MTKPPVAAIPLRTRRRLTFSMRVFMSCPRRSRLDGGSDALIAAATTDIARHGFGDLALGRVLVGGEQRRRLHDLAGLAVAALRHVEGTPRLLDGVVAFRIESFDGRHFA